MDDTGVDYLDRRQKTRIYLDKSIMKDVIIRMSSICKLQYNIYLAYSHTQKGNTTENACV